MASINSELTRFAFMEYLNSMSASELAYWLVHSFTPKRYNDSNDVVFYACKRLVKVSTDKELVSEFIARLWGMHGEVKNNA